MTDPLVELRGRFVRRAHQDAHALIAALQEQDHTMLEQTVHNLAGAAGVFGFADLGAAARRLDDLYAADERPTSDDIRALAEQARALQS